jgi:O6-methylguanine-DNA--protein-cysteine methyltransferase
VASACGSNEIAFFIPCHKILPLTSPLLQTTSVDFEDSDKVLGGFRWGNEVKKVLLINEIERTVSKQ